VYKKREMNRKQNKVKPKTLMVFAFVLILFGFYWIDKITTNRRNKRESRARVQSWGLSTGPCFSSWFSSCFSPSNCQFDIPIAIYVRPQHTHTFVWLHTHTQSAYIHMCVCVFLWGSFTVILFPPPPTNNWSFVFKHLQYAACSG